MSYSSRTPSPSSRTPLPWGQLSLLFLVQLAEPITSTVIYPFIAQLILELGLTRDPASTGYYAGIVESLFFATEALCVLHWGKLSDKIGRKKVLMIGLTGLALSMLGFGLSRTFWGIVGARALAGALNGNVGVSKSAMAELTDETNMATAFAFMPIIWSLGSSIGPFIGGGLEHPHERFPGTIFARLSFFRDFPYFLPCATAAAFSIVVGLATAVWFRETAEPIDNDFEHIESCDATPPTESTPLLKAPPALPTQAPNSLALTIPSTHSAAPSTATRGTSQAPSLKELMTPRLKATVTAYALLALNDIAYLALQPLFMSSPTAAGGLGLEPSVLGRWMGTAGALNIFVQALLFPRLHAAFGEKRVFVAGALAFTLLWPAWGVTWALAARLDTAGDWRDADGAAGVWALLAAAFALYSITQFCFASIFIFVSHAAPRASLGAANGLAQTCTSTARALGPALMTSLWAWSAGWLFRTAAVPPPVHVGGVAVRLPALTVYVVLELASVALVVAGTMLREGRPEASMLPSRASSRPVSTVESASDSDA